MQRRDHNWERPRIEEDRARGREGAETRRDGSR